MFEPLRKIDESLRRTRESFFGRLSGVFRRARVDEQLWDDLEELLIQADVGVQTTEKLLQTLRARAGREHIGDPTALYGALKRELMELLGTGRCAGLLPERGLGVVMVVGVICVVKTTPIA